MEFDKNIGVAQSKILQLKPSKVFDSTGDFIDSYCLSFMRGHGEEDRGQYDEVDEIFSARGAAMIIRLDVLRTTGLFDSDFFGSYEDVDLCWRIRLRGYKVVYVPQSIVYHSGSATLRKLDFSFITFHQTRNLLNLSLKNKDFWELILHPLIIQIVGALILDLFKRKNPKIFLARFKAMLCFLKDLKKTYEKRIQIQKIKKQSTVKNALLNSNMTYITRGFLYSLKFGSEKGFKLYFSLLLLKNLKAKKREYINKVIFSELDEQSGDISKDSS